MPANPPAAITLAYSRTVGLVAVAHGEQYKWAHTALEQAGFTKRNDGAYSTPGPDIRTAAVKLLSLAHRHRTTVAVSQRPFLGDVADRIAELLPGTWTAQVEIYSHPVWQGDLLPWLWDRGELVRTVEDQRVPYAAKLTSDTGVELLLAHRGEDPRLGYLVGALASHQEFDNSYDNPYAPTGIALPSRPGQAAKAITDTFLPAYHQALHARRLDAVVTALDELRAEYDAVTAIWESGRSSDGTLLNGDEVATANRAFTVRAWRAFHPVLTHAPGLLQQCAAAVSERSADADIVAQLSETLAGSQAALDAWRHRRHPGSAQPWRLRPPAEVRTQLGLQAVPAIETWLGARDAFVRIARSAVPGSPAQPPGNGPAPSAQLAVPSPSRPPGPRR
ncbi:hypothetical protein [Streptomyces sp. GbtcB7]|uniref:hypothetical protein n=1 Tax=Streptomyces sp. GbtcB7 TaxID=2824752 RepID=UPI001C2F81B4|nr:hypothetical protein [Streptomyces sp. GbtcB7]